MAAVTVPASGHSVPDAVGVLRDGVAALRHSALWPLDDAGLLSALVELAEVENALAAQRLRLVAEVDARGAATAAGASSTAAWLRSVLRVRPGAAAGQVRLATALSEQMTPTGQPVAAQLAATGHALAEGGVSEDAAGVIERAVRGLPAGTEAEMLERAEEFLLGQAAEHDPKILTGLGRHLLHVLDPDAGARLAEQEADAVAARSLTLSPDPQPGVQRLRGRLDDETAALLLSVLDPLATPRPPRPPPPDPPAPPPPDAATAAPTGTPASGAARTRGRRRSAGPTRWPSCCAGSPMAAGCPLPAGSART